jgi:hypothetical protein
MFETSGLINYDKTSIIFKEYMLSSRNSLIRCLKHLIIYLVICLCVKYWSLKTISRHFVLIFHGNSPRTRGKVSAMWFSHLNTQVTVQIHVIGALIRGNLIAFDHVWEIVEASLRAWFCRKRRKRKGEIFWRWAGAAKLVVQWTTKLVVYYPTLELRV